ncbi:hypothetical protein N7517_001780 [Penicillium concentricum]|uniref:Uncharacterized protein n=1 Tax=Penicillium concentricum TaxID=293559 RepID=A0A9W9SUP1_9EURO|nr:uncharacterized protein N7517_001780 [Penicillium concentricum]KAJ5383869.1 hypothetical protein N7517_001780 [Penicillium concentricum]
MLCYLSANDIDRTGMASHTGWAETSVKAPEKAGQKEQSILNGFFLKSQGDIPKSSTPTSGSQSAKSSFTKSSKVPNKAAMMVGSPISMKMTLSLMKPHWYYRVISRPEGEESEDCPRRRREVILFLKKWASEIA